MKEFLVEIKTTFPDDMSEQEIDGLRAAEAVRAGELAESGHLFRLWRPVGELRSIGIWCGDDEADLREHVLGTLPLRHYMAFTVTPLQSHPNDPALRAGR